MNATTVLHSKNACLIKIGLLTEKHLGLKTVKFLRSIMQTARQA